MDINITRVIKEHPYPGHLQVDIARRYMQCRVDFKPLSHIEGIFVFDCIMTGKLGEVVKNGNEYSIVVPAIVSTTGIDQVFAWSMVAIKRCDLVRVSHG